MTFKPLQQPYQTYNIKKKYFAKKDSYGHIALLSQLSSRDIFGILLVKAEDARHKNTNQL